MALPMAENSWVRPMPSSSFTPWIIIWAMPRLSVSPALPRSNRSCPDTLPTYTDQPSHPAATAAPSTPNQPAARPSRAGQRRPWPAQKSRSAAMTMAATRPKARPMSLTRLSPASITSTRIRSPAVFSEAKYTQTAPPHKRPNVRSAWRVRYTADATPLAAPTSKKRGSSTQQPSSRIFLGRLALSSPEQTAAMQARARIS